MQGTLVVKIGGSAGIDLDGVLHDLAEIARTRPLVVVHGVSDRMARLSSERGIPVEMLQSPGGHQSRYTPPAVRDLFIEAAMQVNNAVISGLRLSGIPALGLVEPVIIQGARKDAVRAVVSGRIRLIRDDYTGSITSVESSPLLAALERGEVAVVPPLAASPDGLLNIDGDRAAAAVSRAINAPELVILSNVQGLYRNQHDSSSFVRQIPLREIEQAMAWAQGRMKRKILSAQEALVAGVGRVVIGDGRAACPISQALRGEGTVLTR